MMNDEGPKKCARRFPPRRGPATAPPLHCWHPTGFSTTNEFSGHQPLCCCFCGEMSASTWRYETLKMDGHGPFVEGRKIKKFDPSPDAGLCKGRT